jgi:protein-S-isoprenylcysteine O-methyltransferase Ste14
MLNGRTGRSEVAVGVLQSRTEEMVCIAHTERFHTLERDAADLKTDVASLQQHLAECAASPASKSPVVKWSLTAGVVAATLAILEGVWAWIKGGTHWWVK